MGVSSVYGICTLVYMDQVSSRIRQRTNWFNTAICFTHVLTEVLRDLMTWKIFCMFLFFNVENISRVKISTLEALMKYFWQTKISQSAVWGTRSVQFCWLPSLHTHNTEGQSYINEVMCYVAWPLTSHTWNYCTCGQWSLVVACEMWDKVYCVMSVQLIHSNASRVWCVCTSLSHRPILWWFVLKPKLAMGQANPRRKW